MVKSSMLQIDEDERKILKELKKNANRSVNEIAERCGFSRQKVWRIIRRLEKDKTIWGYTAVTDDEKKGLSSYIVLIKRTTRPTDKKLVDLIISRKLEDIIQGTKVFIDTTMYIHGEYDWVICFKAENLKTAKIFCDVLLKTYLLYIKEIKLLEVLFPIRVQGILNPDYEKLNEFIIDAK